MAPLPRASSTTSLTTVITPALWLVATLTALPTTRRHNARLLLALLTTLLIFQPFFTPISLPSSPLKGTFIPYSARQIGPPTASTSPRPSVAANPSPTANAFPSSSPRARPSNPVQTAASPSASPSQVPVSSNQNEFLPLSDCKGGLQRMQVILILELCFEILLLFLRCFADMEADESGPRPSIDVTFRGYILVRIIYAIFVLIINMAIYWIGGGPTGQCLSEYSVVQTTFTHLIFYVIFCFIVVIIGIYRVDRSAEKEDNNNTASEYESTVPPPPTSTYRSDQPPTRTSSYYRYQDRPSTRTNTSHRTSYEQPKFRLNLGCCAFNF